MNGKIKLNEKDKNKVLNEILSKINFYETRMTYRLARWTEIAEIYSGRTATTGENRKVSPNTAELYKAIRAICNMQVRMILGQKPPFELRPLDIISYTDPSTLIKLENLVMHNLDLTKFNKNFYRALVQLWLYGSVAVLEQYEPFRHSFLGKKKYATTFKPISLINCAFSLDTYDIEDATWVSISDVQSKTELDRILKYDEKGDIYNLDEVKNAINDKNFKPEVNNWVRMRLAYNGYVGQDFTGGMERITYFGKLDCLDSEGEFCIEIVDRKHIIRSEEYEGLRPVRIATVNTIDVEPLGNGLGDMFLPLIKEMDATKASLVNMIKLAGANMYAKQKAVTDEDIEFTIRNFGILSLDNPQMFPIAPAPQNLSATSEYYQMAIQQFRQATGATDSLQAIVPSEQVTATAVSLSMNEAVRNISVQSEIIAPTLLKDHIKVIIQNYQKYLKEPMVVPIGGVPITLTPADALVDVDVDVRTTTDQDFRPARMMRLREALQLMLSTPPNAIPGKKVNAGYVLQEYLKELGVPNWDKSIEPISEADLMNMALLNQINNPVQNEADTGNISQKEAGTPPPLNLREQRRVNRQGNYVPDTTIKTPVGEVLSAPGDETTKSSVIKKSTIGANNEQY